MNIKLIVQYDGTEFSGWQHQPRVQTVQGKIEEALQIITRQPVTLYGAGRTDAGVHALGQVAHFHTNFSESSYSLQKSLNALLKPSIVISEVTEVAPEFHARFSATSRIYRYTILNRSFHSVFLAKQVLLVQRTLNINAIQESFRYILGEHDFSSFRSATCQASSPIRIMYTAWLHRDKDIVHLFFHANSFLQQMVRILVGTFLLIGFEKIAPNNLASIIESRDRRRAGTTVSPHGLCLIGVTYGQSPAIDVNDHQYLRWL